MGDYLFIIARPDMPEDVKEFYRRSQMFKMLDNGVWETGKPMERESYLELARDLAVNEIVLPDYLWDGGLTVSAVAQWLKDVKVKEFAYAAVVHGADFQNWLKCHALLSHYPEIDTICLPGCIQKKWHNRPEIIWYMQKHGMLSTKTYHILGLDTILELYAYPKGVIRSVDTSMPFSATYNKQCCLWTDEIKRKRIPLSETVSFDDKQLGVLKEHIDHYLHAAHEAD